VDADQLPPVRRDRGARQKAARPPPGRLRASQAGGRGPVRPHGVAVQPRRRLCLLCRRRGKEDFYTEVLVDVRRAAEGCTGSRLPVLV
jgi:hypothetical protein